MFNIGYQELLVLAVIAVLVIGPKDLPGFLRTVGKYSRQLKKQVADIQREITTAIDTEELRDLRNDVNSVRKFNPVAQAKKTVEEAASFEDIKATTPKAPASDIKPFDLSEDTSKSVAQAEDASAVSTASESKTETKGASS